MDINEILKTAYDRLFNVHQPRNAMIFSLGEREPFKAGGQSVSESEGVDDLTGAEADARELTSALQVGEKELASDSGANADQLEEIIVESEGITHQIESFLEKQANPGAEVSDMSRSLDVNLKRIKQVFRLPLNKDVIIREFYVAQEQPTKAAAIYTEGLVDTKILNSTVLSSLMLLAELNTSPMAKTPLEVVYRQLLPSSQVTKISEFKQVIDNIMMGNTVIFIEGENIALTAETKGWEHRGIGRAENEAVVYGPQQAFNENLRSNTALVRRYLKTPNLVTELMEVGSQSKAVTAIMYLHGIANPKLVAEVKRRISSIKTEKAPLSPMIEHYIQDNLWSPTPATLQTERPDRVCAFLNEGHVAIIIDGSPWALIVPVTFWSLFHTAEDAYLRWPYGTFLRIIRVIAISASLLVPSLYVSVVNYHQEMIPTELLLSIAGSREKVPFPAIIEILIMMLSFELIREATLRVPSVIGPTIGIVGAIVIGQAAVAAGVVSPILVVIIAVTALGSFAIPNYSLAHGVRLFQFVYLFAGAFLGFYGVAAVLVSMILHFTGLQSFGVPFTAPVAPYWGPLHDITIRAPNFDQTNRPKYTRPLKSQQEKIVTRTWDPKSPEQPDEGDSQS